MSTKAGVGVSHHRNPRVAGQEAVEQALRGGDIDRPDFVLMFATVAYNQPTLIQTVYQAAGGAPLCGCSSEGTIVGGESDESNFSVAVMTVSSDELRFNNGLATGLKEDSAGVGRAIANKVQPVLNSDALAMFVFPDSLTVNFENFRIGLEEQLNLNQFLPLVGGTAGDSWIFKHTYQYCNDQVVSDGVAWGLLSGSAHMATAVNHGCISMGIEHKLTRTKGNTIYEIDHRPALDVIRDYLSDDELVDWGTALLNFPFGFETTGGMAEEYDPYLIRGMMTKNDETGEITIPTEAAEGTSVWMTRRDYEKVTAGVERLASQIKSQLGDNPAKLVFHFDCAGRGKMFFRDQQKVQLLNMLRQRIGPDAPWLGFYTYGEIGPVRAGNYFHNFTAVVAAVY